MSLARLLTLLAVLCAALMLTLFGVGITLTETTPSLWGFAAIGAGMLAGLPTALLGMLAVEARTFGSLS
jgi:hypothetical protein